MKGIHIFTSLGTNYMLRETSRQGRGTNSNKSVIKMKLTASHRLDETTVSLDVCVPSIKASMPRTQHTEHHLTTLRDMPRYGRLSDTASGHSMICTSKRKAFRTVSRSLAQLESHSLVPTTSMKPTKPTLSFREPI